MARVKKDAAEVAAEVEEKKTNSLTLSRMETAEGEEKREPDVREENGFVIVTY